MFLGRLDDFSRGDHHAQIDHFVAVAAKHDTNDILADVVHVALHGRDQHAASAGLLPTLRESLLLHEGQEVVYGFLHDSGASHNLWQKHFALAEQVANDLHSLHQRPFNDVEAHGIFCASLVDISFNVVHKPLD